MFARIMCNQVNPPWLQPWEVTHSETRMSAYFHGFGLKNALCG